MFPTERTLGLWHSVVAGFDGSVHSRVAVRWAAAEAAVRSCPLHLVRVLEYPMATMTGGWAPLLIGQDRKEKDRAAGELAAEIDSCLESVPGLEVHGTVHDGTPSARLVEHADLVGADVLVVGTSSSGPLARLTFGSVGTGLARDARRPLVAVRELTPVQEAGTATGYAPVVAVADDFETVAQVLAFAFETAWRRAAPVHLVYADPGGRLPAGGRGVPVVVLRRHLGRLRRRHPEVPVQVEAVPGSPARAVLARSVDARLVVVGHRGGGLLRRWSTGSISHTVLHHAASSVALVS